MKPPRFKYHDPATLEDALALLAQYGDDAKVLAGGQSLMPILNFRLARPAHLIDVNRIGELATLRTSGGDASVSGASGLSDHASASGGLLLGAMIRQRALERSDRVRERCPLIAQAMPFVGHSQIRNRGTLGGSLAHADPAAELPAVIVAADAMLTLRKRTSRRVVAAADFFVGQLATVIEPDEMLAHIEVPAWPAQTGSSVQEVAMRLGDFALAGVVTALTLNSGGRIARARIVCFGVEDRPFRQLEAEQSLEQAMPSDQAFAEAGRIVSARVQPTADIHASAAYRKRLAGILVYRGLTSSLRTIREAVA
jgi:aerobic carbon-monoxide dehydrogenase medium subunit